MSYIIVKIQLVSDNYRISLIGVILITYRYSEKELANILGKKTLIETEANPEEETVVGEDK